MKQSMMSPLEVSAMGTHVFFPKDGEERLSKMRAVFPGYEGAYWMVCPRSGFESLLVKGQCIWCFKQLFTGGKFYV